jgi:predicted nucleic acid-binding protein
MNRKVFLDSDIILDVLCKREPFYDFAAEVFTLGDSGKIQLFTTSLAFANVYYILRKILGIEKSKELLRKLRLIIHLVPSGEKIVDLALNSKFNDFEDGIQYFASRENHITILLTRNKKDYKERGLTIQSPEEFLKTI